MTALTWRWSDDVTEVLRRRAEALSAPAIARRHQGRPYVLVVAGGERYALPGDRLAGVDEPGIVTPIPRAEPPWIGVTVVRGRLHPVADLSVLLTGAAAPSAGRSPVILVQTRGHDAIGLRVEQALNTEELAVPVSAAGRRHELIVTTTPDLVHVIDVDAVLSRLAGGYSTSRGDHQ